MRDARDSGRLGFWIFTAVGMFGLLLFGSWAATGKLLETKLPGYEYAFGRAAIAAVTAALSESPSSTVTPSAAQTSGECWMRTLTGAVNVHGTELWYGSDAGIYLPFIGHVTRTALLLPPGTTLNPRVVSEDITRRMTEGGPERVALKPDLISTGSCGAYSAITFWKLM